ncbi:MAG: hypothetical protein ACOZIN_10915 [Myxococcota bacterium]
MSSILSAIGGAIDALNMFNPLNIGIDKAFELLGLPPELKAVAKVGIGVATGNMLMAADGAVEMAGTLGAKNQPIDTEYAPSKNEALCSKGYAAPQTPTLPTDPGDGFGKREALSLTSPEVLSWVPSDPSLAAERLRYDFSAGNGQGMVSWGVTSWRRPEGYAKYLKRMLMNNPALRAEFEAHFGVRCVFEAICGDTELVVRRRPTPPPGVSANDPKPTHPSGCTDSNVVNGQPSAGGATGWCRSILSDPTLSIEEKVELLMMKILASLDKEILDTMEQVADAQQNVGKAQDAAAKGSSGSNKEATAAAQSKADMLQFKLQRLVERRKQMFDLMSNMSAKFNEMARTAIGNLGRA